MKSLKLLISFLAIGLVVSCSKIEPAALNFVLTEDSGLESQGTYPIAISLDRSITSGIELSYTVSGSASDLTDFYLPSSPLTIASGSSSATLNLDIVDDTDYTGEDITVVVNINGIAGEGVDDVSFGNNTTFTYTIKENDLEVELTWTPSSGAAVDFDLDLIILIAGDQSYYASSASYTDIVETVVLDQNGPAVVYYALASLYSGNITNTSVDYTIKISFPDGSTTSNSDTFNANNTADRTLFSITKNGDGNFSASADPLGSGGIQLREPIVKN